MLEKAHRLLISNFDFYQALLYKDKVGQNEVLLTLSHVKEDANPSLLTPDNHLDHIKSNPSMKNDGCLILPLVSKPEP
jgi:hypothetical protein